MEKTGMQEKHHYSGPSGGHGYGAGSGGHHVYSTMGGQSEYGYGHHESSHHSSGSSKKSVALSALTLLAFLFFLHILQTCLQDQMNQQDQQNTQVVMMTTAREGESNIKMEPKRPQGEIGDEYEFGTNKNMKSREMNNNKEGGNTRSTSKTTDIASVRKP